MSIKRITIIGAGNGAQAMAADKTLAGFEVSLFEFPRFAGAIRPVLDSQQITAEWPDRKETVSIHRATTDIACALEGAEVIFVVMPAYGHAAAAAACAPYLVDGQIVVLMPGTGGSLEFHRVLQEKGIQRNVALCETSTLPYGARLAKPGHVMMHNETVILPTGVFPACRTAETIARLKEVYPAIMATANVLETALNNPNPIVHPAATLLSATRIEYSGGDFYLYVEGMTPAVARVYEGLERERLAILEALGLRLYHYAGLDAHGYNLGETVAECHDRILNTSMDAAFGPNSLEPGTKMRGPTSLRDRYITEDVPYGLVLTATLGRQLGIAVPVTEAIVNLTGTINRADYWATGRGVAQLGLAGMTAQEITAFLATGA